MEIIIALVIIGVGLIWYFNAQKNKPEANKDSLAPYKVEPPKATVNAADLAGSTPLTITPQPAPLQSLPVSLGPVVSEPAPVVEPVASKPAKAKKAPAAKKPAAAKKPVAKKAPSKAKAAPKKKTA